jgi:hypothetical protein
MAISPYWDRIEGDVEGRVLDYRFAVVEVVEVASSVADTIAAANLHIEFPLILGGEVTTSPKFLQFLSCDGRQAWKQMICTYRRDNYNTFDEGLRITKEEI